MREFISSRVGDGDDAFRAARPWGGKLSGQAGLRELLRRLAEPTRGEAPAAPVRMTADGVPDDVLSLLMLCCHPSLTPATQATLTLRVAAGLSVADVAKALREPVPNVRRRIARARRRMMDNDDAFRMPEETEWGDRIGAVLRTLHRLFTDDEPGVMGSAGPAADGTRPGVVAIRLARRLDRALPEEGEVAGLLALMLLTESRRTSMTGPDGVYVPISAQDRSLWDGAMIAEGLALISQALARRPIGPYQLWAAIAAVHAEAPSAEQTDWRQILTLHALLDMIAPGPVVSLDRVVAVAMVQGAGVALRELAEAEVREPDLADEPRLEAVRGWLLALSGEETSARDHYRRAALRAPTVAERRYLEARAGARTQKRA